MCGTVYCKERKIYPSAVEFFLVKELIIYTSKNIMWSNTTDDTAKKIKKVHGKANLILTQLLAISAIFCVRLI
jgi:hypothetical protein